MDDLEVALRALGEAVSSINRASLALQRAVPHISLIEQCHDVERLIAVLREAEDDVMVLLDGIEAQAEENP